MTEDYLITEWKNIHELLKTKDGTYLCSLTTLRKKYGPELKRTGVVMRWTTGKGKKRRTTMATWPSKFITFFMAMYQKKEELERQDKENENI